MNAVIIDNYIYCIIEKNLGRKIKIPYFFSSTFLSEQIKTNICFSKKSQNSTGDCKEVICFHNLPLIAVKSQSSDTHTVRLVKTVETSNK